MPPDRGVHENRLTVPAVGGRDAQVVPSRQAAHGGPAVGAGPLRSPMR
jgi:hypothetical protein